jgi:hypothetical protein
MVKRSSGGPVCVWLAQILIPSLFIYIFFFSRVKFVAGTAISYLLASICCFVDWLVLDLYVVDD